MWYIPFLITPVLAQEPAEPAEPPVEVVAEPVPEVPAFDIRGPEWASFGSPITSLHDNLAESGKLVNLGGRWCFSAERKLMGAPWIVQVCSYDGQSVESVMLVLPKNAAQELGDSDDAELIGALYSKLRIALEGQYGMPLDSPDGRHIWLDPEGDQLTLWTGEYGIGTGWKSLYGVPLITSEAKMMAPLYQGIVLSYRQAPGIR